jgi:hypothetical protein
METIQTVNIWCGIYLICRGWPLLGVEEREKKVYLSFDRESKRDLDDFYRKRTLVELHEAAKAKTQITIALKQARGLPTW